MDKKLKIAIIGSRGYPYVYSGYETLVKELSERLVNKNHDVRVYCHRSLFKIKPKYVNGIELVYTPSIETKFLSQIINSFFSFLHVCFYKVDVVLIVNSANGPFGILTKLFGIKTCINVDGIEWLRPKWKGLGNFYFKFSSKLSTILFDEVITDSLEMKKIYNNKFNKNSEVIAYGSTMIKNVSDKLDEFKLIKNDYYLIVGRLIPDNNSINIIKGFLESNSKKKIVIVGDVPYMDKYAESVKKYASKNVILLGYIRCQKKLSRLYKYCYGYIHGHQFGGTNPTMINALDFNLQILALKKYFNVEMLQNKDVIYFQNEIESIAKSIIKFEKKYNTIKQNNMNYSIPKNYMWNNITESYIKTFHKLIFQKNKIL